MLFGILLTILVLDGIFLSVVILLQAGKGGGLAAMGGGAAATEGVLGGRQAQTVLTRATWISATIFMVLAFILSILSSRSQRPESILRQDIQQTAPSTAPEPVLPGVEGSAPGAGGGDEGELPDVP